jgi:hypothetical protein
VPWSRCGRRINPPRMSTRRAQILRSGHMAMLDCAEGMQHPHHRTAPAPRPNAPTPHPRPAAPSMQPVHRFGRQRARRTYRSVESAHRPSVLGPILMQRPHSPFQARGPHPRRPECDSLAVTVAPDAPPATLDIEQVFTLESTS